MKTLSGNSGWPLTVTTTTFFWGYGKTPCPHHPTFSCSVSCSSQVSLPPHAQQRPGWVRVKLHPTHLSDSLWSGLRPVTFIECPLGTRHDIRPWQFNFMANHYYRHNTFYCTLYFLNCLLTLHRHFIFELKVCKGQTCIRQVYLCHFSNSICSLCLCYIWEFSQYFKCFHYDSVCYGDL